MEAKPLRPQEWFVLVRKLHGRVLIAALYPIQL